MASSAVVTALPRNESDEEEFVDCFGNEYFDCMGNHAGGIGSMNTPVDRIGVVRPPQSQSLFTNGMTTKTQHKQPIGGGGDHAPNGGANGCATSQAIEQRSVWGERCRLPSTMASRNDFSIWSFLKQCIGKELSKITMPIVFNEPISFLQRVVEYMEYSELLNRAARCDNPIERMELVTAFAVSATASNWERTGKPFNPLLGETYELDREDIGFKIVCEQVSHHPPVSAFHADSPLYTFHGSIHPKLKFWGSSVQVTPKGPVTLHLRKYNEIYTWQNMNCSVHNVIVGKVWVEHYGEMEVTNHSTRYRSVLQFKPCGWTGTELHKVQGYLYDNNKKKIRAFYGKWVEAMYSCEVSVWEQFAKTSGRGGETPTDSKSPQTPDDKPERGSMCDMKLSGQKLLWSAAPKPEDTSKYYNFTLFAMMLNAIDDQLTSKIAPTDSRLRPDIRLMELGDIDLASAEKNRLEEKQRSLKKDKKKSKDEFKPRWFRPAKNAYTGDEEWQTTGEYWENNWIDNCPDIF